MIEATEHPLLYKRVRLYYTLRVPYEFRMKIRRYSGLRAPYEFSMEIRYGELYRALVPLQNVPHVAFVQRTCPLTMYPIEKSHGTVSSLW